MKEKLVNLIMMKPFLIDSFDEVENILWFKCQSHIILMNYVETLKTEGFIVNKLKLLKHLWQNYKLFVF